MNLMQEATFNFKTAYLRWPAGFKSLPWHSGFLGERKRCQFPGQNGYHAGIQSKRVLTPDFQNSSKGQAMQMLLSMDLFSARVGKNSRTRIMMAPVTPAHSRYGSPPMRALKHAGSLESGHLHMNHIILM